MRHAAGRLDTPEGVTFADNLSPHLAWSDLPAGTRSLALICHDFDVPSRGDDVNQAGREVPPTCRGSTSSTGSWSTCRPSVSSLPRAPLAGLHGPRQARPGGRGAGLDGAPGHQRLHRLVRRRPGDGRRLLRLRRPVPALERLADPPLRVHAVCARRRPHADRGAFAGAECAGDLSARAGGGRAHGTYTQNRRLS